MLFTVTENELDKCGLEKRNCDMAAYENVIEYVRNSSAIFASSKVLNDALLDIGLGVLALPTDVTESKGMA
jgi:hypothetical protein